MEVTLDQIRSRIDAGKRMMRRFAGMDARESRRFVDPSLDVPYSYGVDADDDGDRDDGGDLTDSAPVGTPNRMATNILVKLASVAIGDPGLRITTKSGDLQNALMVQKFLLALWRAKYWKNIVWQAWQKRFICGLGFLFYRWDTKTGVEWEFSHSWDIGVDPFIVEWNRPAWAWRRIVMSKADARARYGDTVADEAEEDTPGSDDDCAPVSVTVYWDGQCESVVSDARGASGATSELGRTENLYGRVPWLVATGDPSPKRTPFPLGDAQLAAGLQEQYAVLADAINSTAENGRPLNVMNPDAVEETVEKTLQEHQESGWLKLRGDPNLAFRRIPGEEVSQALVLARQQAGLAMDSIQGVDQYSTGSVTTEVNTATEAMMIGQRSGARAVQNRIRYEEFLRSMFEITVDLYVRFGGPDRSPEASDETIALWLAMQDVAEVDVIESSTVFRDPAAEQGPLMQYYQVMSSSAPVAAQLGQGVPNLKKIATDVAAAFGRQKAEDYWLEAPAQPLPAEAGAQEEVAY
jgi:hypothetical protein